MKKSFILLFSILIILNSHAQQAVVALPAMNVIYIGLDNPIKIAVEGYKYNQLSISVNNCVLKGEYPNTYLTATAVNPNGCSLFVSYKKDNKNKTDTFNFRIKSIPKPEAMFGTLESGSYPAAAMLGQNTIRAVLLNFVYQGVAFNVVSYQWHYISYSKLLVFSDTVNGGTLSPKLKQLIARGKAGDRIIIDEIKSIGPGGVEKRLYPLELFIETNRYMKFANLLTYQKENSSEILYDNFQPIFSSNHYPLFPAGIIKIYNTYLMDTILISEIKFDSKKIIYEKQYFSSGQLKAEYDFVKNDTMGSAKTYYENGKLKSKGNVIIWNKNIFELFWPSHYNPDVNNLMNILNYFIPDRFAPIGLWQGYHKNGQLAMECNIKLFGPKVLDNGGKEEMVYSKSCYECDKIYSISKTIGVEYTLFRPKLTGLSKFYNEKGNLISEHDFKN